MEQKEIVKVAALQMSSVVGDVEKNRDNVAYIIEEQLEKGTDFLVLPEVWTVGWSCEDFPASAEDISNSKTIELLSTI